MLQVTAEYKIKYSLSLAVRQVIYNNDACGLNIQVVEIFEFTAGLADGVAGVSAVIVC